MQSSPRPRPGGGALFAAVLIALGFVALGYAEQRHLSIPPNTLPWRPVDLNAPPGWIAHWQLHGLARDGAVCRAALAKTPMAFTPLADRTMDGDCGFTDVVRADRMPVNFAPRPTAACGLAAALFWYQQSLQKIAQEQMHARLTGLDQVGTFACRNVNNEAQGRRSQHATANAIDITGFRFAGGKQVVITRDYGKDTPEGRFLDAAHDQACSLFNGVLGPRYNKLHATHFHLDMGPYLICR